MQTLKLLYKNKENFIQLLENSSIQPEQELLMIIYSAALLPQAALDLSRELLEILPKAKIIGSSGSGVIFERKQYDDETLIIIEQFENIQISTHTYSFKDKTSKELALEIAADAGSNVPLMHILFSNYYNDAHEFLIEFNACDVSTKLTGGIVGDIITKNIPAYVFTPAGIVDQGVVVAAYHGQKFYAYCAANISHEPISPIYTIDKMDKSHFIEIENRPAIEWLSEHLGLSDFKEYNSWQLTAENDNLIKFPIILEGHGGASRMLRYDSKAGKMGLYFSRLKSGTRFRLGYSSPLKCIQECADICNQIVSTPIETMFSYVCLFRKMYMQNCAEWEMRPFTSIGICGVFMMGEICNINGQNQFLNGSNSIIGIAEKEHYIEPDFSVFEDLYKIKNDNEQLLNFVLKKQSMVVTQENKLLMEQLLEQQNKFKEQLYLDNNTGLKNAICFSQENIVKQFNKVCMIRVENFDLLFTRLGQHGYYRFIQKITSLVDELIRKSYWQEQLSFYMLNDSTMFIAANESIGESAFIDSASKIFDTLQFVKPAQETEMLICRFVVVVNQKDLLEHGLLALEGSKHRQTYFVVADDRHPSADGFLSSEMEMLQIINQAIKDKAVIPYFQGIHDNRDRKIRCYEALMRIQDHTGKIYAPIAFMDIAKKYHLYASLSACMLDKVFKMFAGRKERVSINLSVHDIKMPEMRDFIFANLQKMGHANNFTFEILEDEEFRHVDELKEFIASARQYGVKIAIDDFGSGYSNFMKLVMLEPDYIKIDGSIVKSVEQSPLNKKVLENIVFLGRQLNSTLIAEFVENESIQKHVESMGIDFSQGYYFAKPTPYGELILN